MSEFVVVVPEGWTQLDWQFITNNINGLTRDGMTSYLTSGLLSDVETLLKDAGQIPLTSTLLEGKLIDDTYFLVRLG